MKLNKQEKEELVQFLKDTGNIIGMSYIEMNEYDRHYAKGIKATLRVLNLEYDLEKMFQE